jgi:hypothetical protein
MNQAIYSIDSLPKQKAKWLKKSNPIISLCKSISRSLFFALCLGLNVFGFIPHANAQNPVCSKLLNNANSCQGVSNVALWLKVVPGYTGSMTITTSGLNFGISNGSFSENVSAGTATMSGTISQGDLSYSLSINLSGRSTTAGAGHSSGCSGYSASTADWYYYTSSSGTMTCTTGNASNITLTQKGGPYEIGTGANLWTSSAYGGAGWFYINGSDQCDFGPVIGGCSNPDPCTATVTATNTGPYCEIIPTNTIQLNAVASGATGTITYAWTGPNGFTANTQNPTSTSGAGAYKVTMSYKGSDSKTACTETATTTVVIKKIAATPTATVTQPGCTGTTGTITITAPTGTGYTYSLNGGAFGITKTFTNKAPGSYTIKAKQTNLCESPPLTVTILPPSSPPTTPVLTVEQPTCASPQGVVTVTSPTGADITYNFGNNVFVTNPVANFTVNATVVVTVTAKNASGCVSTAATATLNPVADKPNAPLVVAKDPICGQTTGSATVTSPTAGFTYTLNGTGGPVTSGTGAFLALTPGSYNITATGLTGCLSSPTAFVVNPPPAGPAAPTVVKTDPSCTETKGTVTVTSPR